MIRAVLLLAAVALTGCSSLPSAHRPPQWHAWSLAHGGVLSAAELSLDPERAEAALRRLSIEVADREIVIRILDEESIRAWSWPGGSVFLTRGLLRALDDDELTAAIAHEIGHLTGEGDRLSAREAERLADGIGCLACADREPLRRIPPSADASAGRRWALVRVDPTETNDNVASPDYAKSITQRVNVPGRQGR